jgi:DNA-binding NarL/FixJ family response regulator
MTRIAPQRSPREQSIHPCLIECEANKCIKIDIAETTVKVHVKAILRKIRVQRPDPGGDLGDERWDPGKTAKQMRAALGR